MSLSRRDFERNLPKKGFCKSKHGDHIRFFHEYNGRQTGVQTKVSHSKKLDTLAGALLTKIRRQLRLDRNAQVLDLGQCPMDRDTYNRILIEKGVFDPEG